MHDVLTTAGPVRGHRHPDEPTCIRFIGIPYAAAPVNDLWLKAPAPHPGWTEPRDCSRPGPTPQRRPYREDAVLVDESIPGDEILNLNIFAPQDAANAPVLVWIHGGGFKAGLALSPLSDGREFARQGIVVVSISYRLGFEGFGWVEDAPANRGLLDQQVALQWVQDNIAAFGGDPTRVTIAGQSAGGGSVFAHLVMTRSQPLFSRAISMSGVLPPLPESEARRRARIVADALDTGLTIDELRPYRSRLIDAELIAEKMIFSRWPGPVEFVRERLDMIPMSDLPFIPWQDASVLPVSIMEGVQRGLGADKPLLMTSTREEFTGDMGFLADKFDHLDAVELLTAAGMDNAEAYIADNPRAVSTSEIVGQIVTDAFFTWPVQDIKRIRDSFDADTETHMFSWCPGLDDAAVPEQQQWARHCIDIPFAWNLLDDPMSRLLVGDAAPTPLAQQTHRMWVDFIKG